MAKTGDVPFYITFCAGMAFGTSSFLIISELFTMVSGLWVALAIFIAGTFCLIISSSISELASMYPSAPGIRTYLKVTLPPQIALMLVYLYLFFLVLVAGIEGYLFALVVKAIFPSASLIGTVLVLACSTMAINLAGVEIPRGVQMVVTFILIALVMVAGAYGLCSAGLGSVVHSSAPMTTGKLGYLAAAAGLSIYLFVGFEWVTMLGLNPKAYEWKIPFAMPAAIIILAIAYSVFSLALAARLPVDSIVQSPIPQLSLFYSLLGRSGGYAALFLSALAIVACFNGGIMGGSRLIYILSREGNLPRWSGKISPSTTVPYGAVLMLSGMAMVSSIVIVTYRFETLATMVCSAIVCFIYSAYMVALTRLRKSGKGSHSFHSPVPKFIQWVTIVLLPCLGVVSLFSEPAVALPAIVVTVASVGGSFLLARIAEAKTELKRQTMALK